VGAAVSTAVGGGAVVSTTVGGDAAGAPPRPRAAGGRRAGMEAVACREEVEWMPREEEEEYYDACKILLKIRPKFGEVYQNVGNNFGYSQSPNSTQILN
jgi:hypothetical protein